MRKPIQNLFYKLKVSEANVFSGAKEILSPVIKGKKIRTRINGIIIDFTVVPPGYYGWGVFKAKDYKTATLVREASLAERDEYLALYPRFKVIVYHHDKYKTLSYAFNATNKNIKLNGIVTILLPENISVFDTIRVAWDGQSLWYAEHDTNANLSVTEQLQTSLFNKIKPEELNISQVQPDQLEAYKLAFENVRDKSKDRIDLALRRSGGKLVKYVDRGDTYTITYLVDKREITSTINSSDLQVQSAGICLSGGDKKFDLQSLVHVIREGERRSAIVVGDYSNYGYNGNGGDDYDED